VEGTCQPVRGTSGGWKVPASLSGELPHVGSYPPGCHCILFIYLFIYSFSSLFFSFFISCSEIIFKKQQLNTVKADF
jgi:hypothetical protein